MGRNENRTLTGTAVAKPDDPASQLEAYEVASKRLAHAAVVVGVHLGEPTMQTVFAEGRGGGHLMIILTAPILDTGYPDDLDGLSTPDEHEEHAQ